MSPMDEKDIYLQHPTQGMQLAMDPRLPEDQQAFTFKIANLPDGHPVDWYVNQIFVASTLTGEYLWRLQPGYHSVRARIRSADLDKFKEIAAVTFSVK